MRRDGTGNHRLVRSTRQLGSPTWSPDGTRLVFELWDGVDTELYRVSAGGTGLRQLTRNNVNDFGPLWGPGGSRLAFTRLSGGATMCGRSAPTGATPGG